MLIAHLGLQVTNLDQHTDLPKNQNSLKKKIEKEKCIYTYTVVSA